MRPVIILDTQPVSQLQLEGEDARRLLAKLVGEDIRITIVTPYEQLREAIARIHSANIRPESQITHFARMAGLLAYYANWRGRILPFDERAAQTFLGFSPVLKRRLKGMDARIAAIALANKALLLSANLSDFRQVPGLVVEDWLREPGPGDGVA